MKKITVYLFLEDIEVVDNDTNEQIESEESTKYDECHEVDIPVQSRFSECLSTNLQTKKHKPCQIYVHGMSFVIYRLPTSAATINSLVFNSNLQPKQAIFASPCHQPYVFINIDFHIRSLILQ